MPWFSYREVTRRFGDVHLIDTPRLDTIVERLAALQRYGMSVRQRRLLGRLYAVLISHQLEQIKPDIVIAVGAMHKMTFVANRYPVIHVSDGLFATIVGYYEKFGRFRQSVLREGHEDHQRVLDKTGMVLFASHWASDSALALYDVELARTRVVPFGANLDGDPPFRQRTASGPLNLLFVGYDWKRKGGDIVLAAFRELRERLPDAELHIIGCTPAAAGGCEGVYVHGRLDKSNPDDYALLQQCYDRASIFFLPSRQEAFGMVFCEAAAYGIPVVSTATGGVPTVVAHDETGLLKPITASASAYADAIETLWRAPDRYAKMSLAARNRYDTMLNWRAWGAELQNAMEDVLAHR
ncbi:MAG: glycosyl transferase group 1 [Sphingobium sp.]|nr:glycosyl transferase group 1 [Sphingobium sp.]